MAHYEAGPNLAAPVGVNRFIRSTKGLKVNSHTVAAEVVPTATLASGEVVKVLQPGTVMARITSGEHTNKVGPYASGLTGVFEEVDVDVSGLSAGTFTLTIDMGEGVGPEETGNIAYDALPAAVLSAIEALSGVSVGDFTVTESSNVYTITWANYGNQIDITADDTLATGTIPALTITQGTATAPAVADGRQTDTNIVGVNQTYLPTQLLRRDVEIGVVYAGVLLQDWCIEHDSTGVTPIALSDTTADAMRSVKGMDILFFDANPEVA